MRGRRSEGNGMAVAARHQVKSRSHGVMHNLLRLLLHQHARSRRVERCELRSRLRRRTFLSVRLSSQQIT